MHIGDTIFPLPKAGLKNPHLLIVISDPTADPDQVLLVPLNTYVSEQSDPSCILKVGDHPFIVHDSFVSYARARKTSMPQLQRVMDEGLMERRERIETEVLRRILRGAERTTQLALDYSEVLRSQGLIPM